MSGGPLEAGGGVSKPSAPAPAAQARLTRLLAANRSVVSELSLRGVLQRVAEAARDLVGARYAAVGVIGVDGQLDQFVYVGVDPDTAAKIGDLPKGRGVLGALIAEARPIRLARIADDERRAGFPPHHPEMTSFLGVPIRCRDAVFGNLYLTHSVEGAFGPEDEELVLALAGTAGVAIDNARLYEESRHRQRWLRASTEVTQLLLTDADSDAALHRIAESVLTLADADMATVVLREGPDSLRVQAAVGYAAGELLGVRYPIRGSLVEVAMTSGRGVLFDIVDSSPQYSFRLREIVPVHAVLAVPLVSEAGPQGAVMVGRLGGRSAFTQADLNMAEGFASQAAVARELAAAKAEHQQLALVSDRDRIARDLHDHVIQRLFAAGLILQSAAVSAGGQTATSLSEVVAYLDDTIRQIRSSIFQLRAEDVGGEGLRTRVLTLVTELTTALGFPPDVRFSGPVDTVGNADLITDVEAVVREAVSNAVRHAAAGRLDVAVVVADGQLRVDVRDDGIGLGTDGRRSGLANLERRATERGGALDLQSSPGRGTQVRWRVPLAPSPARAVRPSAE